MGATCSSNFQTQSTEYSCTHSSCEYLYSRDGSPSVTKEGGAHEALALPEDLWEVIVLERDEAYFSGEAPGKLSILL